MAKTGVMNQQNTVFYEKIKSFSVHDTYLQHIDYKI